MASGHKLKLIAIRHALACGASSTRPRELWASHPRLAPNPRRLFTDIIHMPFKPWAVVYTGTSTPSKLISPTIIIDVTAEGKFPSKKMYPPNYIVDVNGNYFKITVA